MVHLRIQQIVHLVFFTVLYMIIATIVPGFNLLALKNLFLFLLHILNCFIAWFSTVNLRTLNVYLLFRPAWRDRYIINHYIIHLSHKLFEVLITPTYPLGYAIIVRILNVWVVVTITTINDLITIGLTRTGLLCREIGKFASLNEQFLILESQFLWLKLLSESIRGCYVTNRPSSGCFSFESIGQHVSYLFQRPTCWPDRLPRLLNRF